MIQFPKNLITLYKYSQINLYFKLNKTLRQKSMNCKKKNLSSPHVLLRQILLFLQFYHKNLRNYYIVLN